MRRETAGANGVDGVDGRDGVFSKPPNSKTNARRADAGDGKMSNDERRV